MLNPQDVAALVGEALGVVLPDHLVAYIGPGAGLGAVAITLALFLGLLLLMLGLVWYPLKRLRKGRTGDAANGSPTDETA